MFLLVFLQGEGVEVCEREEQDLCLRSAHFPLVNPLVIMKELLTFYNFISNSVLYRKLE